MSMMRSGEAAAKKISSWVRPGVCEVRASALREVSALIRLDLPTFERPANAISTPCIGGSRSAVPAAAANCQSAANSFRPASISDAVNEADMLSVSRWRTGARPARWYPAMADKETPHERTRLQDPRTHRLLADLDRGCGCQRDRQGLQNGAPDAMVSGAGNARPHQRDRERGALAGHGEGRLHARLGTCVVRRVGKAPRSGACP